MSSLAPPTAQLASRDKSPAHQRPSAAPLLTHFPAPVVDREIPRGRRLEREAEGAVPASQFSAELAATSVSVPVAAQPEMYFESQRLSVKLEKESQEPVTLSEDACAAEKARERFAGDLARAAKAEYLAAQQAVSSASRQPEYHVADPALAPVAEAMNRAMSALKENREPPLQSEQVKAAHVVDEAAEVVDADSTGAAPTKPSEPTLDEKMAALEEQVERVPVVGLYVSALLQRSLVKSLVKRAAPYVQGGVDKVAPYVERACEVATPYASSAASKAQPWVHKGLRILMPVLESLAANARVQSVYHHKAVQGGIQKALPYVKPVCDNSRVQAAAEWARPNAPAT